MKLKQQIINNTMKNNMLSKKIDSLNRKKIKFSRKNEGKIPKNLRLKVEDNTVTSLGGRCLSKTTLNCQTPVRPLLQSEFRKLKANVKEIKAGNKIKKNSIKKLHKVASPNLSADETKHKIKSLNNSPFRNSRKLDMQMIPLLSSDKVSAAVTSLMMLLKRSNDKSELLDLVVPVFLQIECIKIPICPTKQQRFKLPHPLVNELSDILLITADKKGAKIYPEKAVEYYTDLLAHHSVDFIQKVMPLRTLKHEYSQYEMRKKLVDQFDVILADACIAKTLPRLLGKPVYYKRKMPIAVHLNHQHLKDHLQLALAKTQMTIKSNGRTSSLQVGHSKMSPCEITRNIVEVSKQLAQVYPGGWENIRSLYLKTSKSPSLPLYLSLLSPNMVKIPVKQVKKKAPVEDELSTMMGSNVVVRPDGTVYLKKVDENTLLDDSHDDEILQEAENYIQSSKTVHYDGNDDGSDIQADALTVAAEQEFLNILESSVKDKKEHTGGIEEEYNGEESSDQEDKAVFTTRACRKALCNSGVIKSKLKGKSQRRGSRGGKKNKIGKEQRKAFIKHKNAVMA